MMNRLPDYILNEFHFFLVMATCKFSHFKPVSKISQKLFELDIHEEKIIIKPIYFFSSREVHQLFKTMIIHNYVLDTRSFMLR